MERSARIRLQEMNTALRNQVELLTSQLTLRTMTSASSVASSLNAEGSDWQTQIGRRDALIGQLVSQSKDQSALDPFQKGVCIMGFISCR